MSAIENVGKRADQQKRKKQNKTNDLENKNREIIYLEKDKEYRPKKVKKHYESHQLQLGRQQE